MKLFAKLLEKNSSTTTLEMKSWRVSAQRNFRIVSHIYAQNKGYYITTGQVDKVKNPGFLTWGEGCQFFLPGGGYPPQLKKNSPAAHNPFQSNVIEYLPVGKVRKQNFYKSCT